LISNIYLVTFYIEENSCKIVAFTSYMLHYTKIIFTICRIISREQRFTRYNCETLCDNGVMYISNADHLL